jgi:hypothetical protein
MDTPQVDAARLRSVAERLATHEAVLGPAVDGGWWSLALRDPTRARVLRSVPMSLPTTGRDTREALESARLTVAEGPVLRDVDTASDADLVADEAPDSDFARTWRGVLVR